MENESEIVRLLTEIRDNQMKQMEWIKGAQTQSMRRAIVALGLVAIGLVLLLGATLLG
jgi:hypothetical protein